MLLCTFLGPESDGSRFEQARVAYQHGAGAAYGAELVERRGEDGEVVQEKNLSEHVERAPSKV